jgi:hypothetical protein
MKEHGRPGVSRSRSEKQKTRNDPEITNDKTER